MLRGVSFQSKLNLGQQNLLQKPFFGAILVDVKPGQTILDPVNISTLTVYPSGMKAENPGFEDDQLVFTPARVVGQTKAIGDFARELSSGQLLPTSSGLRDRILTAIRQVKPGASLKAGAADSLADIDALLDDMDGGDDAFTLQMEHSQAPYASFLKQADVTHDVGANTLVFKLGPTAGKTPVDPNLNPDPRPKRKRTPKRK